MSRRDTARYAMLTLGARWSVVVLGGIALVLLMWLGRVSENAGVPLLAMLLGGAGFAALGTTPPASSDSHEIEPVANQRIQATLDPHETGPGPSQWSRAAPPAQKD